MISFVVPAYNEERLIGATLDAIHAAAREIAQPYELIVANDASTDDTPAIARAHGARVVDCDHRQIARVRNADIRQAMDELAAGGELAKRIVGFGTSAYLPPAPSVGPMRPAGFPAGEASAAKEKRS